MIGSWLQEVEEGPGNSNGGSPQAVCVEVVRNDWIVSEAVSSSQPMGERHSKEGFMDLVPLQPGHGQWPSSNTN